MSRIVPVIKVADMPSAIAFYCTGLGFEKAFEHSLGAAGPHYAGLSMDGCELHLSTFAGDGVQGTVTYLFVDDIDAVYAGLRARGIATDMAPTDQDWGMRQVYVRDPDGNRLRFGSEIEKRR